VNEDGGRPPSASPSSWWTRRPRGTWLPAIDRSSTPRFQAGPSRCVIGWRARPETFEACGFSDLRARFVLWDESSRRQRSRALHGSGRAAPELDAGSPAPGTRPQPRGVPRSTNCVRISEERGAGTWARGRGRRRTGRGGGGTWAWGRARRRTGRGDVGTRRPICGDGAGGRHVRGRGTLRPTAHGAWPPNAGRAYTARVAGNEPTPRRSRRPSPPPRSPPRRAGPGEHPSRPTRRTPLLSPPTPIASREDPR
jgi:hypothetical protein